ncbi:carbohydrate kinase family protein [Candidatus Woesearchaeota archaeon]|jgi:ribokinase|nr:carbohydrate kinase family protein [Candidatus Woesearchaeota archaeon]MBT5272182.1 carbohydrate kinase family protein [Candidatus Woesearchaeota archaeon]MBT6040509.1 carbohydrate kinase family protein [Candidatus Woesearchaeota archaeon]MBT6336888.1 carbohydrate kinase family protein [Candidatus Woesearchaeota archaeon]MBT7927758.1 carbohydrate kinase family protein [Candidatus Woesearchaeota archaeon]
MYDVITVGSATVDVFVKTDNELIRIKTKTCQEDLIAYPCGKKVLIEQLDFMTGGGATNTGVCFSRLGLKTACLGMVGKDDNGKHIIEELKKEKVSFIGHEEEKGMTAYSVILDSIEHHRTILTYKALSNQLKFSKLNKQIKKGKLKAKWFYFCTMLGESFKTLEKLAEYAEKNKIKIAFNPTNYLAKEGPKKLKKILDKTTALVLNLEEAKLLLGYKCENKNIKIERLVKELNTLGPNIVLITDGKNGSYCFVDEKKNYLYHIEPRKVKIMETTGAGDAFTSSFIAGLAKNKPIEFCLFLAATNAESVIQSYGAKNILLTWKQALKEMKKYKHKVIMKKI